ncbi:alkaline phosphatase D family protein [Pseudomonas sp. gcc21]|uniref:alkaline phosphatase D family protein n=1 Tax=Pseudomonas sp. gcc21 TaxID=2726989 RepID=UPI001451F6C7|nr:alkaline phosphatase D family protein [Pseudomonas sp. gcc21]QJD58359.1 alkaline phosphatase D family protein [Pseudomonas sp. gcc21]
MNRRDFLRASTLALGSIAVSTGLQGGVIRSAGSIPRQTADRVAFRHGVASGDPLQDRFIIWTRLSRLDGRDQDLEVGWEVAADPDFEHLLHAGATVTGPAQDYTIKVDILNLQPGTRYYYRFNAQGVLSPVGISKTLPQGNVSQVRFAVLSCANYPAGHFHVYAEAARVDQLDAVVHLGDYLYEYGADGYATADAETLGRTLPADNDGELFTLADYRKRYALYRTDDALQALHAAAPCIAVWDDHEISNDTWRQGAQNHGDDEGDFTARKRAALQAWFEWMPVRPARQDDQETIYRSFDFGNLVSLHMLDTRLTGRDRQLAFSDYYDEDGFKAAAFRRDTMDANRSLLGDAQRRWLYGALEASTCIWQVLGQQVLMGRRLLPRALLSALQASHPDLEQTLRELIEIKRRQLRNDPALTVQEIEKVNTLVPYSLDAWDGYGHEREALLRQALTHDRNLVVLAGDTHNAWANNLIASDGSHAGVEFATSSVSSPGMERYLNIPREITSLVEQAIVTLTSDVQYVNARQRGYMIVTFTPEHATADWRFVSSVKQHDYHMDNTRRFAMATGTGPDRRHLVPVG